MKFQALCVMLMMTLAACGTAYVTTYGRIDPSEKEATIPVGTFGVIGIVKEQLIKDGWKLFVYTEDQKLNVPTGLGSSQSIS